ncbi:hypothetical protein MBEHAL_0060 [Halarchaeum acidiphilum MH1-52-1]|uniref:Uncharacterized protein n=1 Tax=Halarchaeum acidiphilum MH1-52-1 TaxID=1261545 RepID=U2YQR3_9EURY|nr:hypothetical protein MBEHAL_0060 [Halarchaeum acidiphilum MH1-52-1]
MSRTTSEPVARTARARGVAAGHAFGTRTVSNRGGGTA